MPGDIAVFVGENGRTASPCDNGRIVVYRRKQGKWIVLKEKEIFWGESSGLPELRRKMAETLDFLGECKIFVGLSITGVPYFELEKAGFSVWEFEGNPLDFLDYILMEEEKAQLQKPAGEKSEIRTAPVAVADGRYRISLKEIQEGNTGFTTKQVLLPFLRKGDFYELEVLCSHVPPWLEAELTAGNFSGEISKTGNNGFKVTITRDCCCRF